MTAEPQLVAQPAPLPRGYQHPRRVHEELLIRGLEPDGDCAVDTGLPPGRSPMLRKSR